MSEEHNPLDSDNQEAVEKPEAAAEAPKYLSMEDYNRSQASFMQMMEKKFKSLETTFAQSNKPKPAAQQDDEVISTKKQVAMLMEKLHQKEQKELEMEAFNATQEALTKNNVAPQYMKAAISVLKAEGKVQRDDDGKLVFINEYGVPDDLHTGIKSWVNSEDGKIYQAPKGAQGGGNTPRQSARPQNPIMTKDEFAEAIMELANGPKY
jgi:hypothetical protein